MIGNTVTDNNRADNTSDAGITVFYGSTARGNTARKNRQNNILAVGSANALEENVVSESLNGIHMPDGNNIYSRNRASGHTTHYTNPAINIDGGANFSTP